MAQRGVLAELLRPLRGRIALAVALSALAGGAGVVPFIAVAEIARQLLDPGPVDSGRVWTIAVVGTLAGVARYALIGTASLISHYADVDRQLRVRLRLARHLGTLPLGWFTTRGVGEVKKAVQDDVQAMHQLASRSATELADGLAMSLAAAGYLLAIDWRMALITVFWLPIVMLLWASVRDAGSTMTAYESAQRLNNAVVEYADGIAVVRMFGHGARAYRRFAQSVDDYAEVAAGFMARTRRAGAVLDLVLAPGVVLTVVLGAGLGFVAAGVLVPVDVLPFVLLGVGLPGPWRAVGAHLRVVREAQLAATHVHQVLAEPPLPEPEHPRCPHGYQVVLEGVRFSYPSSTCGMQTGAAGEVLRGVDAVLEPGTTTALVGPPGSGKTTLARLIPRFWDVTGGTVRIGGVDVRDIPTRELLALVAVVFQDITLLRDTVAANIRLGRPEATMEEVVAAARAAQVADVIAALPQGFDTVLGADGGGLSSGERQRITIARAILQDAPIVVLDEAASVADPDSEAAIKQALSTLAAGKTVLVIAHRLWTVTGVDQILVLAGGVVAERGRHADLVAARGVYARMWTLQQRVRPLSWVTGG